MQYSKLEAAQKDGKLDLSHLRRQAPKEKEVFKMAPIQAIPEKPKLLPTFNHATDDGFGNF